ncbi:MAG TPA: thioredoxin family protein [Gemmataceae bacterium]|jgi:peroxiredoxin
MTRFVTAALAAAAVAVSAQAAPLKIGSPAPKFSGLESADGKSVSLADFKDKDVVVVCITCNHCPVAIAYQDRIIDFARKHAGPDSKVAFVAINVNNGEEDRLPKMKERAKEKGFTFPYAYDPSQKIARELGASRTPEFFVFNKERKLVYTGALDDSMKDEKVTKHYLADAVEAALKGETPKQETSTPVGCGIQYERKRSD